MKGVFPQGSGPLCSTVVEPWEGEKSGLASPPTAREGVPCPGAGRRGTWQLVGWKPWGRSSRYLWGTALCHKGTQHDPANKTMLTRRERDCGRKEKRFLFPYHLSLRAHFSCFSNTRPLLFFVRRAVLQHSVNASWMKPRQAFPREPSPKSRSMSRRQSCYSFKSLSLGPACCTAKHTAAPDPQLCFLRF